MTEPENCGYLMMENTPKMRLYSILYKDIKSVIDCRILHAPTAVEAGQHFESHYQGFIIKIEEINYDY